MNLGERNLKINTELWGKLRLEGTLEKYPVNKVEKPGKQKLWKIRYFVLADNLAYFENEDAYRSGKKPKGIICLDFAAISPHTDKNKITLRTPGKFLLLKAKDEGEIETWFKALKLAQNQE